MQALDETKNNYIMCVVYMEDRFGLSVADVTTGDYFVTEINTEEKLFDEIYKLMPSELICNEAFFMSGMNIEDLKNRLGITIYSLDSWYFDDAICQDTLKEHFKVGSLTGLGLADYDCGSLFRSPFDLSERDLRRHLFPICHVLIPYAAGKIYASRQCYKTES